MVIRKSIVAALALLASSAGVSAPDAAAAESEYQSAVRYLDQGWNRDTTNWWYFASQGTVFMPYEWFLALEQADGLELFTAPGHMGRLGFLVEPRNPTYNPDGLPVGFAKRQLDLAAKPYSCWKGN